MADRLSLIEPVVGDEELERIEQVLDSGYMTEGPFAREFESEVADIVDADHGITATSCTTGLVLALEASGIGPGDEVIIPDFTYPATANVVERLGAEPVLVDVSKKTFNIDPQAVEEAITDRTSTLMPVSWGGQPLNAAPLNEIATEHGLDIIEDAAWSLGAAYDGNPAGSQFDASIFSFHPRKSITTGEGGVITLDDGDLTEEIRTIKNFGLDQSPEQAGFVRADATNYRLSDVLAAIGVTQLERMDDIMTRRKTLADRYDDLVESIEGIRKPFVPSEATHTFGSYCVCIEIGDETTRDEIIDRMDDRDIETQIGTYALHQTPAFEDATRGTGLDNSRDLYYNLLTLPMEHTMSESDQDRVAEELDSILDRVV
jgi:dTDP-4-amino-4,6-dideoxygalactose transaminase